MIAAVRDKKGLALAHIRLAAVLQRMGRGSERLDSLRLAERYGAELVDANPADMHGQRVRLSANTAMLEALYDETQIGQVVTLTTDVLAKFEQLPEPVREQLQGKTSGAACWSRMDARRPHWPSAINKPTPRGWPFGVTHCRI